MTVTKQTLDPARVDIRPFAKLYQYTDRALQICDLLETLADDLPKRAAPQWREAQLQSKLVLQAYFGWVSDPVLVFMLRKENRGIEQSLVLTRLQSDCKNQSFALSDLYDLISDALLSGRFADEPEALGFALRGHFESLRRDLEWQKDVLWPMAERMCTGEEMTELAKAFERARR